ncbi:MAG: hypothetical protein JWM21_2387 [Acidobacteria bacterium]|nr:hypothetical protein [Acidobacteriota bacterium]
MIERSVYIIFVFGIISGLAGILSVYWWPAVAGIDSLPEPQRAIRRQKRLGRGFYTLVCAISGLVFLRMRVSGPVEMLFGVMLVRCLLEIGLRNWKPKILFKPRCVARDVKTGQRLGEVVSETRDWSRGTIEAFKVRTDQGNLIEMSADSVTIESEGSSDQY